ncbi:MAG: hypothetical protein ACLR6J_02610 [Parabacteroides merdae]
MQPHHKDWFDVSVGQVALTGIDLSTLFIGEGATRFELMCRPIGLRVLQRLKNQSNASTLPRRVVRR